MRAVRFYSTDKNAFVSSLMERIDSINQRSKKLASANAASPKQANKPRPAQKAAPKAPVRQTKIVVKDHPLAGNSFASSAFSLMDESNVRGNRGPRTPAQGDARRRPAGAERKSAPRQGKKPFERKTGRRTAATAKEDKPVQKVVQKELVSHPLRPQLSVDEFFYGKPAKLATTVRSSVAAVAKEALLESKYPYKLPRSIVEKLDDGFTGNSFILQKDWNLEVDPAVLGERIKRVVKGEAEGIVASKDAPAAVRAAERELMRSGDLSTLQKQTIYDVASGLKSARLLVENAVWNK